MDGRVQVAVSQGHGHAPHLESTTDSVTGSIKNFDMIVGIANEDLPKMKRRNADANKPRDGGENSKDDTDDGEKNSRQKNRKNPGKSGKKSRKKAGGKKGKHSYW